MNICKWLKNSFKKKNIEMIRTINVHPDAFDLSADVHEWCKLN